MFFPRNQIFHHIPSHHTLVTADYQAGPPAGRRVRPMLGELEGPGASGVEGRGQHPLHDPPVYCLNSRKRIGCDLPLSTMELNRRSMHHFGF